MTESLNNNLNMVADERPSVWKRMVMGTALINSWLLGWLSPGKKTTAQIITRIFSSQSGVDLDFFQIQWHVLLRKIPDCRGFCGTDFLCWVFFAWRCSHWSKLRPGHWESFHPRFVSRVRIPRKPLTSRSLGCCFCCFWEIFSERILPKSAKKQIQVVKPRFVVLFFFKDPWLSIF